MRDQYRPFNGSCAVLTSSSHSTAPLASTHGLRTLSIKSGHLNQFKDTHLVQTLQEQSGRITGQSQTSFTQLKYSTICHSERLVLLFMARSVVTTFDRTELWQCVCVITHVCHASALGDSMQRSMWWLTVRQHCNWATQCWSIPAFPTLKHLHTNKLHLLKTITQQMIAVCRAFIN